MRKKVLRIGNGRWTKRKSTVRHRLPLLLGSVLCTGAGAQTMPRNAPKSKGISSQAVQKFVRAADKNVNRLTAL